MVDRDGQARVGQAERELEFGIQRRERRDVETLRRAQLEIGVAVVITSQAIPAEEPGLALAEGIMDFGDPARELAVDGRHQEDGRIVGLPESPRHRHERDRGVCGEHLAVRGGEGTEAGGEGGTLKGLRGAFGLEDLSGGKEVRVAVAIRRGAATQHEAAAACGVDLLRFDRAGESGVREVVPLRPEPGVHHFRVVQSGHLTAGWM